MLMCMCWWSLEAFVWGGWTETEAALKEEEWPRWLELNRPRKKRAVNSLIRCELYLEQKKLRSEFPRSDLGTRAWGFARKNKTRPWWKWWRVVQSSLMATGVTAFARCSANPCGQSGETILSSGGRKDFDANADSASSTQPRKTALWELSALLPRLCFDVAPSLPRAGAMPLYVKASLNICCLHESSPGHPQDIFWLG